MAEHASTTPPDRGRATSFKRKHIEFDESDIGDELTDEAWYALKHEDVVCMSGVMCDNLITPLRKYARIDKRINDLIEMANVAKKFPETRFQNLAVLGEQGAGKSSLINALLERQFLDRSGASEACTAFAIIISYKEGADDHAKRSDVKVVFLSIQQFIECIREQINRWDEVLHSTNTDSKDVDEESIPDSGNMSQRDPNLTRHCKKNGAATAREFFKIIFDTARNEEAKQRLQRYLHQTNIKEGDFFDVCCQQAQDRFFQLGMDMKELNVQTRVAHFENVHDRTLEKTMTLIKRVWPFVKDVTITTGHILLRHGLRLFDLPGYGDMSQLREGVINEYRWKADFEMVVAPSLRLRTSTKHDRYIDLSIRLKGPNKTILVANKSDELINEDNLGPQIRSIAEDPFPALNARLEHINTLFEEGQEDDQVISDVLDTLLKEATIAYIKYETKAAQSQMQEKGIKVFLVSALAYKASTNRLRGSDQIIDREMSGIVGLRQFLSKLPAATNYRNYWIHVCEVLPAFRNQGSRILENHTEDKTYAAMRHALRLEISSLHNKLGQLVRDQLESSVGKPWTHSEEQDVIYSIQLLVENSWVHPRIWQSGFAKMLRENGIPVDGVYLGRNLNDDLLGCMKKYLDKWYNSMSITANDVARRLHDPVERLLLHTQSAIDASSAEPTLRLRAGEELANVKRRISTIYATLRTNLRISLSENHLRFTTEIDIYCPIASEMKPCYERAQDQRLVSSGTGTYNRQRSVLRDSIINPSYHASRPSDTALRPLLKKIERKIMDQQREWWKADCDSFVTSVLDQMENFSHTSEQLLMNASYMTAEHKEARKELRRLLAEFDKSLADIKGRFDVSAQNYDEKRVKLEVSEDKVLAPSTSAAQNSTVSITQNDGWAQFRGQSSARWPFSDPTLTND